jgi:transcriptional regulator with XRE-family HTH domain
MDIAAHFGDNLIRCRKHADLSQDELAIRASLHRTEVSQSLSADCASLASTRW